jgi:hypothetical protein
VLVFEGAEEALDDPVGLRALHAGADVTQQRAAQSRPSPSWSASPPPSMRTWW